MAKLHFTDIVAMAKSGWTPDAVNSMLDRFEEINSKDESEDHEEESHDDEGNSPGDENDSHEDESDDEKDKEIAALKAQVEQLQKDNSHQNNDSGEKKSLDDLVDDIFREFY